MRQDEGCNDPFQHPEDQKRIDVERYWQQDRVHNIERQMEHHWQ